MAYPKVPCAMNRRVKATGTMALTQPPRASTIHSSQTGIQELRVGPSPQSTGDPLLSGWERGLCPPKEELKPSKPSQPRSSCSSPTLWLCRAFTGHGERQLRLAHQQRRGTGTIFRPVLTMTSDKTSTTEPLASVRGIAGTRM